MNTLGPAILSTCIALLIGIGTYMLSLGESLGSIPITAAVFFGCLTLFVKL